jgi:hypothetical protein
MTEMPDATKTGPVADAGGTRGKPAADKPAPKPPARPPAEVRADIVRERAALGASFENLRTDLDDAVDEGRRRVSDLGRRARVIAPAVGAALAVVLFLRSRARDRS